MTRYLKHARSTAHWLGSCKQILDNICIQENSIEIHEFYRLISRIVWRILNECKRLCPRDFQHLNENSCHVNSGHLCASPSAITDIISKFNFFHNLKNSDYNLYFFKFSMKISCPAWGIFNISVTIFHCNQEKSK